MKALLVAVLLLLSATVSAEIYKWTDKHGVVHYEDRPPGQADKIAPNKVEKVELSPIQILDDGSVRNTGKEEDGLLAQWLGKAEDLRIAALNQIAEWRGTTPVASNKPANVEIYTTAWCKACKAAKQWLNARGIPYKEYDIQKDANAALRMRKLGGGGGVPFAIINGQSVQGFSPGEYQAALH